MPRITRNDTMYEVEDITSQVLAVVELKNPLKDSIVAQRLLGTHQHEDCCRSCNYLCMQCYAETVQGLKQSGITFEDVTLAQSYKEAAFCINCKTALFIWPDGPEWQELLDMLCPNHAYTEVEIFTYTEKKSAFNLLFNAKRLQPTAQIPEYMPSGWDYSAKHVADERRDIWPNAVPVDFDVFEREVKRRNTCSNCRGTNEVGYEPHNRIYICRECLF